MNENWPQRVFNDLFWTLGFSLSVFFLLSFSTFDPSDPGWSYSDSSAQVQNFIGPFGAYISDWCLSWFGFQAYFFPFLPVAFVSWILRSDRNVGRVKWVLRSLGLIFFIPALSLLCALHFQENTNFLPRGIPGGGIIGYAIAQKLVVNFGSTGSASIGVIGILLGLTSLLSLTWSDLIAELGSSIKKFVSFLLFAFFGSKGPSQLSIENQSSLANKLILYLTPLSCTKFITSFFNRGSSQSPELDVACVEAELLGIDKNIKPLQSLHKGFWSMFFSEKSDEKKESSFTVNSNALANEKELNFCDRELFELHDDGSLPSHSIEIEEDLNSNFNYLHEPVFDEDALDELVAETINDELPSESEIRGTVISKTEHENLSEKQYFTEVKNLKENFNVPIEASSDTSNLLEANDQFENLSSLIPQPKLKTEKPQDKSGKLNIPNTKLLDLSETRANTGFSAKNLNDMGESLIQRLLEFGVKAEVVGINPGPVVTRFEIAPAPGVKASRISNLAKDLARSLAVVSVRVVEVIPGKSSVGIEIPNSRRAIVRLSDLLNSETWHKAESVLTLALGHDISGEAIVADLGKMPHLLVAGTTGSGKSVGINGMILSMLYKASPDQLRLILVDPKMLELSVYEGIPHLLTPVVTDMKDAATTLRWCVAEMEKRYRLMAALGVRNIDGFNCELEKFKINGEKIVPKNNTTNLDAFNDEFEDIELLPRIVVVIDEFADMMIVVGKKVDQLIARLAQKARAAGIHLILATQRPSVDVITGLIKANIPSRISFHVSSKIDSRTVLDQGGAEQLLGHGDMLYLPSGKPIPIRVHGAFVSDDEVHRVAAYWKKQSSPEYLPSILHGDFNEQNNTENNLNDSSEDSDELYDSAVSFVIESRRASISAVQRKFKIGYNRAARIIESMEISGVVSTMGSNGFREVLIPSRSE